MHAIEMSFLLSLSDLRGGATLNDQTDSQQPRAYTENRSERSPVAAGVLACCRAVASSPAENASRKPRPLETFVSPQPLVRHSGRQDAALYGRQGYPPLHSLSDLVVRG